MNTNTQTQEERNTRWTFAAVDRDDGQFTPANRVWDTKEDAINALIEHLNEVVEQGNDGCDEKDQSPAFEKSDVFPAMQINADDIEAELEWCTVYVHSLTV